MNKLLWASFVGTAIASYALFLLLREQKRWQAEPPAQMRPDYDSRLPRDYADLYMDLIDMMEAEWKARQS